MGDSLVHELQRLAQDTSFDVRELLLRAKTVAVKLDLDDARAWIDLEIGGYKPPIEVPPYRVVQSELIVKNPAHGWNPVAWGGAGNLQEHFATHQVRIPIAEIVEAANDRSGEPGFSLTQAEMDALAEANDDFRRYPSIRSVSRPSLFGILGAVRAKVQDWALALEKRGVLGEGMTFADKEKRDAAGVVFRARNESAVVLIMSANPPGEDGPLEAEKEHSRINKVLNGSRHQAEIAIVADPDVDLPEFSKNLRLHKPVVVHLTGHGGEDGSLVLRDEDGQPVSMTPEGLAKLLAVSRKATRLVVLNACSSNALASLLVNDIECVIGMTSDIGDQSAVLFSQSLYAALFDGESVADAFETAKAAVMARYPEDGENPVLRTRAGLDAGRVRIV
jgi:hypothetical protein